MSHLNTKLEEGIANYPILYIPHFYQNFILEVICDICGEDNILEIKCTYESIMAVKSDKRYRYCADIVRQLSTYLGSVYGASNYPPKKEICVIKNVTAELLKDSGFISLLHQFAAYYEESRENESELTIILCVPSGELPPLSISGISYVVDVTPPTAKEIEKEIENVGMECLSNDNSLKLKFARALQGLHLYDVRQIIQSTINTYGNKIANTSIKWAQDQKQQLVRKTGILEVIEPDVTLEDVGGLKYLKEKVRNSARVYKRLELLQNARVPLPKGFLLLGMPGCGKSMIAKATADEFKCPLIKLDMGKLLGKYVGDSEHNLQIALDVVDSAHPCVLWIDEIEKAFAGTNDVSGDGDAVMMRLMGKFLSWMQERTTAVFIMATANDVLKPELMRKGRFDEVFFIDFPSTDEAEQIIQKTVERYNVDYIKFLTPLIGENGKERRKKIAEEVAGKGKVRQDLERGLSGAEIKSLIDSFVIETISDEIKLTESEKRQVDISTIEFKDVEFEKALKSARDSAMILQKSENKDNKKKASFIDKIYTFKEEYMFPSASDGPKNRIR